MPMTKISSASTISIFISLLHLSSAALAFSPADQYLINCGSRSAETIDSDHRLFAGDDSDDHRFLTSTRTINIETTGSPPDSSNPIYRTARAFDHPAHYVFPIRDLGTHHLVRLHFHPLQNDCHNLFKAQFHVVANGFLLLRDYRFTKTDNSPVIKEFAIPVDAGELKITFVPSGESKLAFVSAIEVISTPKDLIPDIAQPVGSEKSPRIDGLLVNGFETVHRLNVGGFKVTPFNDSLWRTWITDDDHLVEGDGSQTVHFSGRIKYQTYGASQEVAPDNVLNTARIVKGSGSSVSSTNISWTFEVGKGYKYMVRMHFCDIASVASNMLYFNVYINGNLAYENLDMSDLTNGLLASPFYADFIVSGGENSGNLAVSVGPSSISLPNGVDGILNGIEIFKLNNSMGSFDGEVCADAVWRGGRRGHLTILLPLVAGIFLLLSVSMFTNWRRENYGSMGWSRLPVDVSEGCVMSPVKA